MSLDISGLVIDWCPGVYVQATFDWWDESESLSKHSKEMSCGDFRGWLGELKGRPPRGVNSLGQVGLDKLPFRATRNKVIPSTTVFQAASIAIANGNGKSYY